MSMRSPDTAILFHDALLNSLALIMVNSYNWMSHGINNIKKRLIYSNIETSYVFSLYYIINLDNLGYPDF